MIKTMRVFAAAVALFALSAHAKTPAPVTNSSMAVGDGTTVNTTSKTTIFLGTEYNPTKCMLQFNSLQCKLGASEDCGQLNGYKLECVKLGKENGKEKQQCQCLANQTDACQNSTAPAVGGVMQFGECSNNRPCVDSYGHVPTKLEQRTCAEKIHCVKEINTTATVPAEICHTCRSCIAQNDANNAKLSDKRRFDCTKICPREILDSIAKRNQAGVGIADEVSSASASASSGSEEESSTSGSLKSAAKPTTKPPSSSAAYMTASTIVGTIVAASLSVAVLL